MVLPLMLSVSVPVMFLLAVELAWGGGPAPVQSAAPVPKEARAPAGGTYRIGAEDVLDINVWNNASLSRTVPVRPDGKISLPLVKDVQAAGLTAMELGNALTKRLAEYMPAPEVSVIVREVQGLKVSVLGEVKKPGRFEMKSGATVLDAIAMAGGLSEFASRGGIVVLRQDGAGVKRIPFNYKKILSGSSEQENFSVQRGDIILVP